MLKYTCGLATNAAREMMKPAAPGAFITAPAAAGTAAVGQRK
jgi:hypothetical protein